MATQYDVYTYDIQYYIEFMGEGGEWEAPVRVTEDKSFDPDRQRSEYSAQYLCERQEKKRTAATTDTYSFSIDAVGPGGLQQRLYAIEDSTNVRARLVRTCAFDFEAGKPAAGPALPAKRCEAFVNMDPMSGSFGELASFSGSVSQTGEWEKGTFDPATGEFSVA